MCPVSSVNEITTAAANVLGIPDANYDAIRHTRNNASLFDRRNGEFFDQKIQMDSGKSKLTISITWHLSRKIRGSTEISVEPKKEKERERDKDRLRALKYVLGNARYKIVDMNANNTVQTRKMFSSLVKRSMEIEIFSFLFSK